MFCSKCGKEIDNFSNFCSNCGCKVKKYNKSLLKLFIVLFLTLAIVISAFIYFSSITYNNKIEQAFNYNMDFMGSKVLVKVKHKYFNIINKQKMDTIKFRLENNLYKYHLNNAVVMQVTSDSFMLFIPNIFDNDTINDIIKYSPILEFKQKFNDKWISTDISSSDIKRASLIHNNDNKYLVNISFNNNGRLKFAKLTNQLINKQIGIFIDNKLVTAPTIREPILGGEAIISGGSNGFSYDEAKILKDMLNTENIAQNLIIKDIR